MNNFKHKKLISSQKHQKLENVFEKFFFLIFNRKLLLEGKGQLCINV